MIIKKEFILDGLGCASCAMKMENNIKKIDGVISANVNFATSTLKFEAQESKNINHIINEVMKIILAIEPHVLLKEKNLIKSIKQKYVLVGLDCANCASKIDVEINKIIGIKNASIDFVSKKLNVEADESELFRIEREIKEIVNKFEPHVEVVKEKKEKLDLDKGIYYVEKNELFKLALGGFIFAVAIIFNLSFWIEISLYGMSYLLVGGKVVLKAIRNIIRGQVFDENFLMTLATVGAFAIKEYPEAVAVMLFYQIGELFQSIAVNKSRKSIEELMDIRPDYANLKSENDIKRVTPEEVRVGELIIVKPGEKIPLDGTVIEGFSMVDTSALTGESLLREIEIGSDVLAGFINTNGVLVIKVTKEFDDSTVAKILNLVENAASKKAPTENFITKFARYYTPIVVFVALALAVFPPLLIKEAVFSQWLYRALVFLVISCPCALVVSIPLSFFGGIGAASKKGVLVKGGNYLEALNNVSTVVFDKTGTLTKGVFKVREINPSNGFNKEELLKTAAIAESFSNHPIAKSILEEYGRDLSQEDITSYEEIVGLGIKVNIGEKNVFVGNDRMMKELGLDFVIPSSQVTIVHVAIDGLYAGHILIADEIKEDAKESIKRLKILGIKKILMLTGDNYQVAQEIAKNLDIDEFYAQLLPDQKVEKLEEIIRRKDRGNVVFVGDGINDAPVLARADIGVAMGGLGSDAAIEAADIVLMTDEPSKLLTAIETARKTRNIVWQNIIFALGVKGVVLLLGASGFASMWEAVFADVGVALIAVLNAIRVMK